MKQYTYSAIICFDEEDLVYVVHVPNLGIIVEATTEKDAIRRAKHFMMSYIETAVAEELDIPESTDISSDLVDFVNGAIISLTVTTGWYYYL